MRGSSTTCQVVATRTHAATFQICVGSITLRLYSCQLLLQGDNTRITLTLKLLELQLMVHLYPLQLLRHLGDDSLGLL